MAPLNSFTVVLAALKMVSLVSSACVNTTTTIRDAGDASTLALCPTFTGSIVVATDSASTIQINGVQEIQGSLIVANNSGLVKFAAPDLVTVTENSTFSQLPVINNVTLPSWSASDTIILDSIGMPSVVRLDRGIQNVHSLYITNTGIPNLVGLPLTSFRMDVLYIADNEFLTQAVFKIGNITQNLVVRNNSAALEISFPVLQNAYNVDVRNVTVVGMPQLQSVSHDLSIQWGQLQNVSFQNLSFVGNDLTITNNDLLADVDLEALVQIQGSLSVIDNNPLNNLDGLSELSYIGGDMNLDGPFTNTSIPKLGTVRGNVTVNSSDKSFDCSQFRSSTIQGTYTCNNAMSNGTAHSSSGGLTGRAIAGIAVGCAAFVILLIVGEIWWILRQKKAKTKRALEANGLSPTDEKNGLARPEYQQYPDQQYHQDFQKAELSAGDDGKLLPSRTMSPAPTFRSESTIAKSMNFQPVLHELPETSRVEME